MILARAKSTQPLIFKKIILNPEWKPVAIFITLIIIFSGFSTLFAAYSACFGEPVEGSTLFWCDTVMEMCFVLDIIKNFLMQYTDPREPREPVRDLYKITMNYVKGAFIYDLIGCSGWPLRYAFRSSWPPDKLSLIYLLRIFRLSKVLRLLNLQNF